MKNVLLAFALSVGSASALSMETVRKWTWIHSKSLGDICISTACDKVPVAKVDNDPSGTMMCPAIACVVESNPDSAAAKLAAALAAAKWAAILDLAEAADVRVVSMDGRILSSSRMAAGRHELSLPSTVGLVQARSVGTGSVSILPVVR